MKKLFVISTIALLMNGCATGIKNISVAGRNPAEVRECTVNYSQCASHGVAVGFNNQTLNACAEAYEICINTCKLSMN